MSSGGRDRGTRRWNHPCWADFRQLTGRLDFAAFPTPAQLNDLLPSGTVSGGGAALRFVPASSLPGGEYERLIFEQGEVSTRENDWHDLFNALVWCRLPRIKAAINAMHIRHLDSLSGGRRGPRRDALTLLDESGALVITRRPDLLQALARRDWQTSFVALRQAWSADTRIVVCGHALLEKFLDPWKSITAHVLLIQVDSSSPLGGPESLGVLDKAVGERLLDEGLCDAPGDLSPLPLAGVPGWWQGGAQDAEFYADDGVFRAPPAASAPAPVHRLGRL